jgi:flagellar protein FlaG
MAQNTITTAILIIAGVIAAAALINAMFPAVYGFSGSVSSVSEASGDQMKTDFTIISEGLDPSVSSTLHVYVKNTGRLIIASSNLAKTDVYFGNGTNLYKCKYDASSPSWQYSIQDGNGDQHWNPGETLDVAISAVNYDFMADRQIVRLVAYNGVTAGEEFTL